MTVRCLELNRTEIGVKFLPVFLDDRFVSSCRKTVVYNSVRTRILIGLCHSTLGL